MIETNFNGRSAVQIENDLVRVTILRGGGHIAEFLHKPSGVNPLWVPPWPSIEPDSYNAATDSTYGSNAESKLLAGIMGHNLCLGLFGPPSDSEAAAGVTVHGEASVEPYKFRVEGEELVTECTLPLAQLSFERRLRLEDSRLLFQETVKNNSAFDQPIAWTQHVTLGPPFLSPAETRFQIPAKESIDFAGTEFSWPLLPEDGGPVDLTVFGSKTPSGRYTAHLLDPDAEDAWFLAWAPASGIWIGYRWLRRQFPWIGIWEENGSRTTPPWNGRTLTRGMEFGVSPIPETRQAMISRPPLFGAPGYAWVPAKGELQAEYQAAIGQSDEMPQTWNAR